MESSRSTATTFGALGGVVAALVVALVSTWIAAEANRTEALRQERREAYVDFLGSVMTCQSKVTFSGFSKLNIPTKSQLNNLARAEVKKVTTELFDQLRETNKNFTRFRTCSVPLEISQSRLRLLTTDERIRDAAHELTVETYKSLADPDAKRLEQYVLSLSRFEVLASDDANAPLISPLHIQIGGLIVAEIILLLMARNVRKRIGARLSQSGPKEDSEA